MSSLPGRKPFNWPAAILIYGWMVVGLLVALGVNVAELSPFYSALPSGALMWRPEMSSVGLILFMSPLVFGGLALWLMPLKGYSRLAGAALIGAGVVAFAGGVAWEAGAGMAVYSDRIVHRESGFAEQLRVERFTDIRRVETACSSWRRRGSSSFQNNPTYIVVFASGYSIDVWTGSGTRPRGETASPLEIVRLTDRQARAVDAVRAPARKPDGSRIGSPGCAGRLAESLSIQRSDLQPLFEVHRSELHPDEFTVVPTRP